MKIKGEKNGRYIKLRPQITSTNISTQGFEIQEYPL